jgi:carbohydrate-selective porin OprB
VAAGADLWTQDELTGDWNGYRKRLEDQGVKVGLDWVAQGFDNFQGGIHAGTTFASTADLSIALDAGKLIGVPGGKFYVDLEDHAGPDPSENLVGDVEKFTKLNYSPFLQIAEIWYQETWFDGKLRLKLGKVDANSEFSVIDNGLPFLNSSTQVTPTILVFPTRAISERAGGNFADRMSLLIPNPIIIWPERLAVVAGGPSGRGCLFYPNTGLKPRALCGRAFSPRERSRQLLGLV